MQYCLLFICCSKKSPIILFIFFKLFQVFEKYASIEENGEKFMTNEDFVVKYLQLLPQKHYNHETLLILAGVIDSNKDNRISFDEFSSMERKLCHPDALYKTSFQLFDTNGGEQSFLNQNTSLSLESEPRVYKEEVI